MVLRASSAAADTLVVPEGQATSDHTTSVMSSGTGNDGFGHRGWTSCSFGTFRCAVPSVAFRGVRGVHLTTNLGLLSVRCGPDPTRSCVWRAFRGRTAGNFVVPCMRCTYGVILRGRTLNAGGVDFIGGAQVMDRRDSLLGERGT